MILQTQRILPGWHRAAAALSFLVLLGPAVAEGAEEAAPTARVQALASRYALSEIRLQEGPHGPTGSFHLIGDLTPPAFRAAEGASDPADLARAVLRTLGPDLDLLVEELRQDRLQTEGSGRSHVLFRRYVAGLRVESLEAHVHIEPDGSVIAVQGVLVPVTDAMASAAANAPPRPEKDEIVALLQEDLSSLGTARPQIRSLEKLLTSQEPYVVWKADVTAGDGLGRWLYRIDAATGEILDRQDALEAAVPSMDEGVPPAREEPEKAGHAATLPPDLEKTGIRLAPRVGVKTALGDRPADEPRTSETGGTDASYALTPEAAEKREVKP